MVVQTIPEQPPLVEPPFDEARALMGIESPDPKFRSLSAEMLKTHGTKQTANTIEDRILNGNPSRESKKALRDVLLVLTSKYRDFLDQKSWARRRLALTQTLTNIPVISLRRQRRAYRH